MLSIYAKSNNTKEKSNSKNDVKEQLVKNIDITTKLNFDSKKLDRVEGKVGVDFSLGAKEKDPIFSIKISHEMNKKIKYSDIIHSLFNLSRKDIFNHKQKLLKEITINRHFYNDLNIVSKFKTSEKSIKSFIEEKNSILENTSSFDHENSKNILGFKIRSKSNSLLIGWIIENNNYAQGYLGATKTFFDNNTLKSITNITLQKWNADFYAMANIETFGNTIGISIKNKITNFQASKVQMSLALEPLKLFKILLWYWIKENIERKYLLSLLKQTYTYLVINYENHQWKFKVIFALRNAMKFVISKEKEYAMQIDKFEFKQNIYKR